MPPSRNSTESPPPDSPRRRRWLPAPSRDDLRDPLQLGVSIVGTTAVFGGIGWWIDSGLGTFPILMVIGAVAGLFGILYATMLRLREADRLEDERRRSDQPPPDSPP